MTTFDSLVNGIERKAFLLDYVVSYKDGLFEIFEDEIEDDEFEERIPFGAEATFDILVILIDRFKEDVKCMKDTKVPLKIGLMLRAQLTVDAIKRVLVEESHLQIDYDSPDRLVGLCETLLIIEIITGLIKEDFAKLKEVIKEANT